MRTLLTIMSEAERIKAVSQHPEEFTRRKRQLTLQTADSKPVLKGEKPVAFEKNALIDLLTNGAHPQAKVFKSITIASRASGANGQTKNRTTPPAKEPKPPQFGLR